MDAHSRNVIIKKQPIINNVLNIGASLKVRSIKMVMGIMAPIIPYIVQMTLIV
jgi:hypothetical protein